MIVDGTTSLTGGRFLAGASAAGRRRPTRCPITISAGTRRSKSCPASLHPATQLLTHVSERDLSRFWRSRRFIDADKLGGDFGQFQATLANSAAMLANVGAILSNSSRVLSFWSASWANFGRPRSSWARCPPTSVVLYQICRELTVATCWLPTETSTGYILCRRSWPNSGRLRPIWPQIGADCANIADHRANSSRPRPKFCPTLVKLGLAATKTRSNSTSLSQLRTNLGRIRPKPARLIHFWVAVTPHFVTCCTEGGDFGEFRRVWPEVEQFGAMWTPNMPCSSLLSLSRVFPRSCQLWPTFGPSPGQARPLLAAVGPISSVLSQTHCLACLCTSPCACGLSCALQARSASSSRRTARHVLVVPMPIVSLEFREGRGTAAVTPHTALTCEGQGRRVPCCR